MKIQPFGKNIQIKLKEKKQIAVGDKAFLADHGEVISIGDEVKKIKVSDVIVVRKWGVIDVDVDGTVYLFVPETDEFIISYVR